MAKATKRTRGREAGQKTDLLDAARPSSGDTPLASTRAAKTASSTTTATTTVTTDTTHSIPPDDSSSSDTPEAVAPVKRRKLRKGTFSCIECKRRKVRCRFAEGERPSEDGAGPPTTGAACLSCQRHGTSCVGQEYAAPSPSPRRSPDPTQQMQYNDVGKRIAQVEALVGELVRRRAGEGFPERDKIVPAKASAASSPCSAADHFDRELESILQQDALSFSHWMHDRFLSAGSPKRLLSSRSPSPSPAPVVIARAMGSHDTSEYLDDPPSVHMRLQLEQLEQELIANRLLFPARPPLGTGPLEHQTLSKQLQSVLPTIDHALRIMNRGALFTLRRYRSFLAADAQTTPSGGHTHALSPLLQKRDSGHPVLLARELIQLAVCLQMMHKDSDLRELGLPGVGPWETADRYFEVAANLVTCQDSMVSSQEGLESLLLQAFYMVNKGDLRGGWMTLRRALGIAQLIGLPPPSWHNQPLSLHFVWTRLLFSERFLSLMLGLPSSIVGDHYHSSLAPHQFTQRVRANYSGVAAGSGASGSNGDDFSHVEHLAQDLERLHALIIPRIAARNDRLNQLAHEPYESDTHAQTLIDDYRDTRDIDYAFRQAAQTLPTKWWAVPNLIGGKMQWAEQIEETARLMAQAKHYHLLVLLHLPYLTERRPSRRSPSPSPPLPGKESPSFLDDGTAFAGGQGTSDKDRNMSSGVNFREFGKAAESEAEPLPVADDIAFAFGIDSVVARAARGHVGASTMVATMSSMADTSAHSDTRQQPSESPSPPSNSSSTLAASPTDLPTNTDTSLTTSTSKSTTAPDTTFSRLGALGAAREVLSRFMVFRYCTSIIARCHAFDFEAFVAAMAILLTHMDAHTRGRDNVIHYQRPSDLGAVDKAVVLMHELADITKEPVNKTRSAILERLIEIEGDAAAGAQYQVWTEGGTLGRGDGRLSVGTDSQVQTMSVPYFGTIHIKKLAEA